MSLRPKSGARRRCWPEFRLTCRPGRSSRKSARPSPRRRRRTPSGRIRAQDGRTSSSPATGFRPACQPPSKGPCVQAIRRLQSLSGRARMRQDAAPECFDMNIAFDLSEAAPSAETLERHISRASKALLACQHKDGHWCFELEADATIAAEYVLLRHFRGENPDLELERLISVYLRRIQGDHGGWPLVHAGPFDISASVKAYFALKMIGDDTDAPHMAYAREAILAHGGAAKSNVFTRFLLALYGAIPWRGVPTMPVEIMLLPRWFPFHLNKVSYWARTVLVPLLVLQALKPRPANPRGVTIAELFVAPPETVRKWPT